MAKREKRPFVIERLTDAGVWSPWLSEANDDPTEFDCTASALKFLRDCQTPGEFRIIQVAAHIKLELESRPVVKLTEA